MKKTILCLAVVLANFAIGCGNAADTHSTGPGDTAALVKDTANTLNASPVNDTTVPIPDTAKHP